MLNAGPPFTLTLTGFNPVNTNTPHRIDGYEVSTPSSTITGLEPVIQFRTRLDGRVKPGHGG
jgi:hypothetical protein